MNKTQFYRTTLAGAVLGLAVAGVVNVAPASAAPTSDCREVSVNLVDRKDTGSDGSQWAKDTMTRTLKVCLGDEAAVGDKVTYYATVTDKGTFKTVAGTSPKAGAALPAGVTGTVNGGFRAKFTAPKWENDFNLTAPGQDVSSSQWVKVAFPAAQADNYLSVYRWAYKTTCESYLDNNGVYTGDIVGKVCAAQVKFTKATCKDPKAYLTVTNPNGHVTIAVAFNGKGVTVAEGGTVTREITSGVVLFEARQLRPQNFTYEAAKGCPSASPSPSASVTPTRTPGAGQPAPSQSTSAAGLPVTGPRGIIWVSVAGVLIAAGVAALTAGRRRRNRFEA